MSAVTPRIVDDTRATDVATTDLAATDVAAPDGAAAGRAAARPAGQPAARRAVRRPTGSLGRVLVVSHPAVLAVNQHQYLALRELGWDVRLVVPARWHNDYRATGFAAEALPGMEDAVLRRPVVLAGQPQRHAYLTRPGALLRRLRPDVVLLEQEPFAMSAAQWGLAATRAGIPFGVQAAENLDRPFPAPKQWIRSAVLAHAAFVMARSPSAAALVQRWGASGAVAVVPHPVVPWEPAEAPRDGTFTIGYAGRLVEAKGVRDLLAAADRMATPARVLVVGNGPLHDEVARHPKVELWDAHAHHDMPAAYARMDVLVLPSRRTPTWEEQFGRVLVEALSCGVPVIGSATGEIPWVVETTGGGWCTPEGDVDALAALLDRVASHPGERAARAAAGAAAVTEQFSTPAVAASTSELLQQVVTSPPGSGAGGSKVLRRGGRAGLVATLVPSAGTSVAGSGSPGWAKPALTFVAHDLAGGGGMERMHTETLRRLAAGWDVLVLSTTLHPSLAGLVRWQRVRVPRRPVAVKLVLFGLVAGWWLVRNRPAGVLHVCGAIVPNRADVATVHLCHAGVVAATGHRAPPDAPLSRRVNTSVARAVATVAERWCYRPSRLGVAHAVSNGLAEEVRRHYPGVSVAVVPNGVDLQQFRTDAADRDAVRLRTGVADDALVALFVGGDWNHKGLGIAIDAVAEARRGGADVRLWVVGSGDRDRYRELARRAGVDTSVEFLGRHADPAPFYRGADVLVLPSRYEACPLVALEAAASGIPVVAAAVHGAVDLVGADEAGAIVRRDPAEFGRVLADLAGAPERRRMLGAEARRRVGRADWAVVTDRLDGLLRSRLGAEVPAWR